MTSLSSRYQNDVNLIPSPLQTLGSFLAIWMGCGPSSFTLSTNLLEPSRLWGHDYQDELVRQLCWIEFEQYITLKFMLVHILTLLVS
jgi:hypothetical protein